MNKRLSRERRHRKIRTILKGTTERPRLVVFKSNKHIYTQLVDDTASKTLISANDLELKDLKKKKSEIAFSVGELVAKKALEKKISEVVFDRGGNQYTGRIKAVAEGARKGGLKF